MDMFFFRWGQLSSSHIFGKKNKAGLLKTAYSDMGKDIISMVASCWTITKSGVDALIPTLQNLLRDIPESVPIVIYMH